MNRTIIHFTWLCGSDEFDTYATNQEDAHDFACEEVQRRGKTESRKAMETKKIVIHLGMEARETILYKKKNGISVYWSPFTGERIVIRRPLRKLWEATAVRKLEARLEQSRRCPERPSRQI